MYNFFKIHHFIFAFLLFTGCGKENDLLPAATSTVNENATASTEELLLELEITLSSVFGKYVVLDSVKNIEIKINNDAWGSFHYFAENKLRFSNLIEVNDFSTTENKFSHAIVLDYLTTAEDYQTAGEFADFIKNFLQPGNYFCTVESITVFDNMGSESKIDLYRDFILDIQEGEKSVYVGKIEIEL